MDSPRAADIARTDYRPRASAQSAGCRATAGPARRTDHRLRPNQAGLGSSPNGLDFLEQALHALGSDRRVGRAQPDGELLTGIHRASYLGRTNALLRLDLSFEHHIGR